eukprot:scaffold33127_cov38-Cyclotella_meneghiniana.AAC.2
MSRGEEVSKEEKRLTRSAVRMKQEDVGEIVFGELQEDGQPHPESPFIKDFTPEKIMHGAEELGYYPWHPQRLWTHPKIRHEIGQEEETPIVRRMRWLQERYEELKYIVEDEGFNTSPFNSTLPTTSGRAEREETIEGQAQALAKTAKTSTAGAIWLSTFGDVLNGDAVLRAREIQRKEWQDKEDARKERQRNAAEELEEAATEVYHKFKEKGEKGLNNTDLKALIKFVVAIEARDDGKERPSKYTNKAQMLQRLSECEQPWHTYFETPEDDGESGSESSEEEGSEEGSQRGSESESESESEESEYED